MAADTASESSEPSASPESPETSEAPAPPVPTEGRFAARPLLVVGAVSLAMAVIHGIWIWNHRRLGALDPDESGYIATALRYHRTFSLLHPYEFIRAVGGTGFAPLVPLLSVPLLWLGPVDPRTVMLMQPILMVVGAVAVAGITLRLATPRAAIAAGCTFVVIPTVVLAAQTYWFGLSAAVSVAVAMWALVASERCTTRVTWWFGAGLAAMLLSRTMSLGFLPGALLAAVIVMRKERLAVVRLAQSLVVLVLIAGPWWFVERSTIFGYLTDYGYGHRASLFGEGGPLTRFWFRVGRVGDAVGLNVALTAVVVIAITAALAAVANPRRPELTDRWRSGLALALAAGLGLVALVSTSNSGVWFELPIVILVIPLAAMVISQAPPVLRFAAMVPIIGMAVVQSLAAWWVLPPETAGLVWIAQNHIHSTQQEPGFAEYDLRLSTAQRPEARRAAADWWALTSEVSTLVHRIERSAGPTSLWLSGNMEMFNTNTMNLFAELHGRGTAFHIPDTTLPSAARRADLTPTVLEKDGTRSERILVVALHDHILFTPDHDVASFTRQARALGWRTVRRVPMPGGGTVEILRFPKP